MSQQPLTRRVLLALADKHTRLSAKALAYRHAGFVMLVDYPTNRHVAFCEECYHLRQNCQCNLDLPYQWDGTTYVE